MTTKHKYFLNLAFQIAEKNLGKTRLNPTVGAIVVKNNSIISSGTSCLTDIYKVTGLVNVGPVNDVISFSLKNFVINKLVQFFV